MEHFLVVSDDVDGTRDFYRDVLGLQDGERPPLGFAGYWLYLGAIPCLHLADRASYASYKARVGTPVPRQTADTGAIDHIAFNATGFEEMIGRLEEQQLTYRRNDVDSIGLKQIFIQDPNNVTLELNFLDTET
jgi:catechol 2,3-dioxygenase-like lactoylglutathione lyase family enzyme